MGIEIFSIMIIVILRFIVVLIFLDIVRNVYIFKKSDNVMFLMKIEWINNDK